MKPTPEERFEALYWAHHKELLSFIRRRTSSGDEEDVVADTFVVVWRRIDEVPDPARGWIFAVARNILRNHQRGQHRQDALEIRLKSQSPVSQSDPSTAIAARTDVARAWNKLTTAEREVIALTAWDGLSQEEAALVQGCTKATYAVRLYRARKRLLHLLNRTSTGGKRG